MEDDSIVTLACSMYAKKGIYALLLGSGISKAAGIPTGWDITNSLINKIAGEELSNPADWYIRKYGQEPDYSEIVKKIGRTQAERSLLLREYFEPSQDDEDLNLKKPTKAHKSIARLIKSGYVKVIITTNFDRLLEQALFEESIVPEVIANIDQIRGATPLALADCVIVKVHGDYKDARIRNTESELANYELDLRKYVDRILDEFGLIICGWSGDWDAALRGCLERCKNHRFSTYWLHVGEPSEEAERIIKQRWAEKISIKDADDFFCKLEDSINGLSDLSIRNKPISISIAKSKLKRWIENNQVIKIRDFIIDECKNIMDELDKYPWHKYIGISTIDDFNIIEYRGRTSSLIKMLEHKIALISFWDKDNHFDFIIESFNVLTKDWDSTEKNRFMAGYNHLSYYYPACRCLLILLLVCIKSNNYKLLYGIFEHKFSKRNNNPFMDRYYETPISIYLYTIHQNYTEGLFEIVEDYVPDEKHFWALYDKAMCFWAMYFWDKTGDKPMDIRLHSLYDDCKQLFENDISLQKDCPIIKSGFFNSDINRLIECIGKVGIKHF